MKGLENQTYLIALLISNAVAILVLWVSWKHQRLARLLFFVLFTWAAWTNWKVVLNDPKVYQDYAQFAILDVYKNFIGGWFSQHTVLAVGTIATCQALIAISMLLRGTILKLGAVGAIVFLLAIVPLGVGSGFPCTLILAIAMIPILRQPHTDYLWKTEHHKGVLLQ